MAILIPLQVFIFSLSFPPETVDGWFDLFEKNWFLGLIHLDLIYIVDNVLVAILYLAIYMTLRVYNESLMAIALLLGYLGIAAYFSSNTGFEMLSVSNLYHQAATEAEKLALTGAAQALLASWRGTAFNVYYVLNGITLLIMSSVMLKSSVYSKKTAFIGLASGVLMVVPSTAGTIGLVFSLLSLIPWIFFCILVSRTLFLIVKKP